MSYSVDWIAKVISVPAADLTLVSGTRYSLDMADFLAEIRRLEWEFTDGLWAPTILDHTNTRYDFAGVNYAPFDDLLNDYTVEFTGVATRVDLLGSNNDIVDVLIPTGISIVPSNSAGLQLVDTGGGISETDKNDIRDKVWQADPRDFLIQYTMGAIQSHLAYAEKVHIDTGSPTSGTLFPSGTAMFPVNNLADAKEIADFHGIEKLHLVSNLVVGATESISDYTISGVHNIDLLIILTAGCTTQNTRFEHIIITGTFGGKVRIDDSILLETFDFKGIMIGSIFADNISVIDPATYTLIHDCGTGKVSPPIEIDMNSAYLTVGNWKGNLKLVNKVGVNTTYIEIMSGTVEIDSTCIAGTIIIAGLGIVIDNSGVGCTVILTNLLNSETITDDVWDETLTGATHNIQASSGRRLRQLGDVISGTIDDPATTVDTFITTLTEARDDFYNDQLIRFTSGNLEGYVRPILSYDGTTKTIVVAEPMIEAPDNGSDFDLIPTHVHPLEQIADAVWNKTLP